MKQYLLITLLHILPQWAMRIPSQHTHLMYVGTTPQWEGNRQNGTEKDVTGSKAGSESLVVIFTSRPLHSQAF